MYLDIQEKIYGKELRGLLSAGWDWMVQYSNHSHPQPSLTKSIIAAALHALERRDIEAFLQIQRVENLTPFLYALMKSWLKDEHSFPKMVVLQCFSTLEWLIVNENISLKSLLVSLIVGLEETYFYPGLFVKTMILGANGKLEGAENDSKKPEWRIASSPMYTNGLKEVAVQTKEEAEEIYDATAQTDVTVVDNEHGGNVQHKGVKNWSGSRAGSLPNLESLHDMREEYSVTPLELAVDHNKPEVIMKLVKGGADLKQKTVSGETLLHLAIGRGNNEALEALLCLILKSREGKESISGLLNLLNKKGHAPLHVAAASGQLRMVKILTAAGASVSQLSGSGMLPMHLTNNMEIIVHLVRSGTDVNLKTRDGDTVLHFAVYSRNSENVEALIDLGADPNMKDEKGRSPIDVASQANNKDMVNLLIKRGAIVQERSPDGDWPIHKAASEGRLEALVDLLERGVDINIGGYGGYTPLQYAAKHGRLDIVKMLVQRGADINLGNDWHWTPLHHAAHYSRCDIAQFLIEAGANTQIVDTVYGMTPFRWAKGNKNMIKLLKSKGIYK